MQFIAFRDHFFGHHYDVTISIYSLFVCIYSAHSPVPKSSAFDRCFFSSNSLPREMTDNFWLANRLRHLVVQPADERLNPPEGYLFVQDGLIISCGVLYAICYAYAMILAVRDRVLPGTLKYLYVGGYLSVCNLG